MEAELREIRDHLSQHPPFDKLLDELLDDVVGNIEITYFKADSIILERGQPIHALSYIRSGGPLSSKGHRGYLALSNPQDYF